MTEPALNAVVQHREDLTDHLAIVRVTPEGWALPDFEPGQYATLGLPDPDQAGGLLRRVYSIASPPGRDHLEFYIQLVKQGDFTKTLWPLVAGDPLFVSPSIAGSFTLEGVPPDSDVVLVATGTGLAPFASMVRHFLGGERWRRCIVMHGARTSRELGYRTAFERLAAEDPTLTYLPTLTRQPEGEAWDGPRGRVQALLDGDAMLDRTGVALDPDRCHVFLCGNPAMIDDVEARLTTRGFRHHTAEVSGNLHFERYW
ncbi:MAG: ferredoxin--NADP reductase [Planctomycetota bacterium]|jgi:ferredoxin--NADP+ reductase